MALGRSCEKKYIRRVTILSSFSVVLELCFLFFEFNSSATPKIVPYSELITSIQDESLTKVLLEEGSRRIYFNAHFWIVGDTKLSEQESPNVQSEDMGDEVTNDDGSRTVQARNSNVLKKLPGTRAPQSVLMSMRTTLITIISLWIPLMPLIWLLYRQLFAANSPAKKRRPDNSSVGFDDIEGVDSAKLELMEFDACKELFTTTN